MTNLYFLGIIVGSFVLIQIELIVILLIYLCFYFIGLQWLGEIVFCSLIAIMVISHLLTTVKASKYIKNNSADTLESELEYRNLRHTIFNNPVCLGVTWRVIEELKNIKKVIKLDFNKK